MSSRNAVPLEKYTGIFAISVNGVEGWELYEKGGINTERLVEFLQKFITEKYRNKLIILDNASAHKNDTIRDLVNKHNKLLYSVCLLYTSPSPRDRQKSRMPSSA